MPAVAVTALVPAAAVSPGFVMTGLVARAGAGGAEDDEPTTAPTSSPSPGSNDESGEKIRTGGGGGGGGGDGRRVSAGCGESLGGGDRCDKEEGGSNGTSVSRPTPSVPAYAPE